MRLANMLDTTSGHDIARKTVTWFLFGTFKYEQGARFAVARHYNGGLAIVKLP
jgi:hypothetical protein